MDTRLLVRGKRFSSICAMDFSGIVDVFTTKGSVNADIFCDFIERNLVPKLMPFDGKNPRSVVLMDNVKFHHCSQVLAAIEGTGALVHFLPPYSPDLNPAEVFSKLKYFLQQNDEVIEGATEEEFDDFILQGFCTITADDCYGYFKHAGYV